MARTKTVSSIVRRRRARKTVSAPVNGTSAQTNPLADLTTLVSMLAAQGLGIMPLSGKAQASVPEPTMTTVPTNRPHKTYAIVANPTPPSSPSRDVVYSFLKAHGPCTHREIEQGTKLTEGQIKGAVRELRIMGYLTVGESTRES